MGNAYPQAGNREFQTTPIHRDEDADWDAGMDTDTVSLLEENARLRALVVRLSDLVLRSVVDEK
jgi:hypothetical protein